jgi:hypothetical protein
MSKQARFRGRRGVASHTHIPLQVNVKG